MRCTIQIRHRRQHRTAGRLVKLSLSYWGQPIRFCTYRVDVGARTAKAEASWEIAESKGSFGRRSEYMAKLIGKQLAYLAGGWTYGSGVGFSQDGRHLLTVNSSQITVNGFVDKAN